MDYIVRMYKDWKTNAQVSYDLIVNDMLYVELLQAITLFVLVLWAFQVLCYSMHLIIIYQTTDLYIIHF